MKVYILSIIFYLLKIILKTKAQKMLQNGGFWVGKAVKLKLHISWTDHVFSLEQCCVGFVCFLEFYYLKTSSRFCYFKNEEDLCKNNILALFFSPPFPSDLCWISQDVKTKSSICNMLKRIQFATDFSFSKQSLVAWQHQMGIFDSSSVFYFIHALFSW